eukprot:5038890-Pleurochrysis_carterae.AAC.5
MHGRRGREIEVGRGVSKGTGASDEVAGSPCACACALLCASSCGCASACRSGRTTRATSTCAHCDPLAASVTMQEPERREAEGLGGQVTGAGMNRIILVG